MLWMVSVFLRTLLNKRALPIVVERVVPGHVECSGWLTSPEVPQNSDYSKHVLDQNELSYNLFKVGNIYDNPELLSKAQRVRG